MTITPSDSLDLLIAHGPPDATDFAKQIAGLPGAYYAGLDEAYKRRTQDAFQGGVPMIDTVGPDGKPMRVPNWDAIGATTLKAGGTSAIPAYATLAGLDLERQRLQYGQNVDSQIHPPGVTGAPPPTGSPGTAGGNTVSAPAAPRIPSDGTGQSITGIVSPTVFGDQTNRVAAAVANKFRLDQTQQLSPEDAARVQEYVAQIPRPPQQPAAAAPAPAPTFNDRFSPAYNGGVASTVPGVVPNSGGGITPAGRTDQQQLFLIDKALSTGMLRPDQAKSLQSEKEAILKRMELTDQQKNYRLQVDQDVKAGRKPPTFQEFQDKDTKDKQQLAVLEKFILPEMNESKKGANSATKDIEAIGQVTEQLNADKGIISGIRAGDRLTLQKVGSYFGFDDRQVANTEAFRAAMGQRVASVIKAFGSGTAISEGDRKYTQQMVGGQIDLDEKSIRKILDIGQRAAQATINRHNDLVDRTLKATPALQGYRDVYRVEAPTAAKTGGGPAVGTVVKGFTFKGGDPKDPASWTK